MLALKRLDSNHPFVLLTFQVCHVLNKCFSSVQVCYTEHSAGAKAINEERFKGPENVNSILNLVSPSHHVFITCLFF